MQKKISILVIPSWYPNKEQTAGGSQFQEQAELLLEKYDVRVLFGSKSCMTHSQWVWHNGFKYAGPLVQATTPNGLREYRFDYRSWINGEKHQIGSLIEGYREAMESMMMSGWKPDLIHARCSEMAGVVASYLSKLFGIPWVLTEHQVFALDNLSKYYAKLIRRALNSANVLSVVSQHQLRSITAHYIYRPMVVVGNLVDEERFPLAPKKIVALPFKILTVMYPGRIKDPETFFKALHLMVLKGHGDFQALVIGSKLFSQNDTSDFLRWIEKYQLQEICHVIPKVSRNEMHEYYADSDVFVSTSLAETFGIAVREAMTVGRPVVCTASGGVDDDIFDFNGFKTNIYDYQAVADALIKIKTGKVQFDPNQIREYVLSRYGRAVFLERFSNIYESVLKKEETS